MKVRVEPAVDPDEARTLAHGCANIIGIAEGLPSNMAQEHYIHGTPQRSEE